jgi:myosin heavy subunit
MTCYRPIAKKVGESNIWYFNSSGDWSLGKIITQDESSFLIQDEFGNKVNLDKSFTDTFPCNDNVKSDMSNLIHLNEPAILHNLKQRYVNTEAYTYMGMVLIAVNPFKYYKLPSPFLFISKPLNSEMPHPFAIAGNCNLLSTSRLY